MGSSLPNLDAKDWKKKKKKKTRADSIKHTYNKNNIENNNLYDAWIVLTHDACSNAVRIVQLHFKNHRIGLNIEFISKTPNFENPPSKIPTNWPNYHYKS